MGYYETLNEWQREKIDQHLTCVIKLNETVNLTRIDNREKALILHVEDSLSGMEELNNSPDGLYGDLGSGAGYPGIPLSIATGRKTVLIDSRKKKMELMEGVIVELGLTEQIRTFAGRAELLAQQKGSIFTALTARALAKLPILMELASPLLVKRGRLICYKANIEDSELEEARNIQKATGMKLLGMRSFELDGEYKRCIVNFEKVSKPTVKLPRREGEAQRNPLR